MKKILLSAVVASALSMSNSMADSMAKNLVCFDSMRILQEAKENQKIAGELNGKIEELQRFVKDSQQKLVDMQTELDKNPSVLSKDAIQEKTRQLLEEKRSGENNW